MGVQKGKKEAQTKKIWINNQLEKSTKFLTPQILHKLKLFYKYPAHSHYNLIDHIFKKNFVRPLSVNTKNSKVSVATKSSIQQIFIFALRYRYLLKSLQPNILFYELKTQKNLFYGFLQKQSLAQKTANSNEEQKYAFIKRQWLNPYFVADQKELYDQGLPKYGKNFTIPDEAENVWKTSENQLLTYKRKFSTKFVWSKAISVNKWTLNWQSTNTKQIYHKLYNLHNKYKHVK